MSGDLVPQQGGGLTPAGTCTIASAPHGARPATETRRQRWRLVETLEVSDE